jgi:hypothetical protein
VEGSVGFDEGDAALELTQASRGLLAADGELSAEAELTPRAQAMLNGEVEGAELSDAVFELDVQDEALCVVEHGGQVRGDPTDERARGRWSDERVEQGFVELEGSEAVLGERLRGVLGVELTQGVTQGAAHAGGGLGVKRGVEHIEDAAWEQLLDVELLLSVVTDLHIEGDAHVVDVNAATAAALGLGLEHARANMDGQPVEQRGEGLWPATGAYEQEAADGARSKGRQLLLSRSMERKGHALGGWRAGQALGRGKRVEITRDLGRNS